MTGSTEVFLSAFPYCLRYSTSKCHTVQDLENLKYFGYRGEAVASLAATSSFLEITSRAVHSRLTYTKPFLKGKPQALIQAEAPRPCAGTTVTAFDLFHNLPVRRKRLNEALEMEAIRYRLSGLALIWPRVSFSLRDDSVGHVILQTHKCSGVAAAFSNIFTPARARKLMEVEAVQNDEFKISGLVSVEGYSRNDLQYVFINKRLVLKSSIHKQVNKILGRSLILRRKGLDNDIAAKLPTVGVDVNRSPTKQGDRYGIFVISVECPYKAYDITFDPSKTLVEFRDWPKLIHLLQDMLYPFLRKHNLLASEEATTPLISGEFAQDQEMDNEDAIYEERETVPTQVAKAVSTTSQFGNYGRNICITDTQNGVLSKAVHRPRKAENKPIPDKPGPSGSHTATCGSEKVSQIDRYDEVELLETPLIRGAATKIHDKVQSDDKDQRVNASKLERAPVQCKLQHARQDERILEVETGRPSAEMVASNLRQGAHQSKVNPTLSHQPSNLISSEHTVHCERTDPSKEKARKVKFATEENSEMPQPSATPLTVTNAQRGKRKEITLSTGCYSSTLRLLREGIHLNQRSRAPEIITNSLQQLRKSTRQAISELGDLYKTPERVTCRRRSSDDCNVSDDPTMLKHARANNDAMDIEEVAFDSAKRHSGSGYKNQASTSLGRLSSGGDLKEAENESYKFQPGVSDCGQSSVLSNDLNSCMTNDNKKQNTLNSASFKNSVSETVPQGTAQYSAKQRSGKTSQETDRPSAVANASRSSLLRPMKAHMSHEELRSSHHYHKGDSYLSVCGQSAEHLTGKRKSPQRLSHSTKLAKLMRGEKVDEERKDKSKSKSLLSGFQYRNCIKKDEPRTGDCSEPRETNPLKLLREASEVRFISNFNFSGSSNNIAHRQVEPAGEGSRLLKETDFVVNIRDCPEKSFKNAQCSPIFLGQTSSTYKQSESSLSLPSSSSSLSSDRPEKIIHCYQCRYLRTKTRRSCCKLQSDQGESNLSNPNLPFQKYKSPESTMNGRASPKMSVILNLPILQNHGAPVAEVSCDEKIQSALGSDKLPRNCPEVLKDQRSSTETTVQALNKPAPDSNTPGRFQDLSLSCQQTTSSAMGQQTIDNRPWAVGKDHSPLLMVSQGFAVPEPVAAHTSSIQTNESRNDEHFLEEPSSEASIAHASPKSGYLGDCSSIDLLNSSTISTQCLPIEKNNEAAMYNEKDLINLTGTESDLYLQVPLSPHRSESCEHQTTITDSSGMLNRPSRADKLCEKSFPSNTEAVTISDTQTEFEVRKSNSAVRDNLDEAQIEAMSLTSNCDPGTNLPLKTINPRACSSDSQIAADAHERDPETGIVGELRTITARKLKGLDAVDNCGHRVDKPVNGRDRSVSEPDSQYFLQGTHPESNTEPKHPCYLMSTNVLVAETLSQVVAANQPERSQVSASNQPERSQVSASNQPERSQVTASNQPERSQVTASNQPERSQVTASNQPERSQVTASNLPERSQVTVSYQPERTTGLTITPVVITVPETESLENDQCHEKTSGCDLQLPGTAENLHLDQSDPKKCRVHCQSSSHLISYFDESQSTKDIYINSTSSLALTQNSCSQRAASKEDTDSFPFFSKPSVYSCSSDLVNSEDLNQMKDAPDSRPFVAERSESLFDDSEKFVRNKDKNSSSSLLTNLTSREVHTENLPSQTELAMTSEGGEEQDNFLGESHICSKAPQETPQTPISNHDVSEVPVGANINAEHVTIGHAREIAQEDTQWSSGDQALLMMEMPNDDAISVTAHGLHRRTSVQLGNKEQIAKENFSSNPASHDCVPLSAQSPSFDSTTKSSREPITISSVLGSGMFTSSLSLLRQQAALSKESQVLGDSKDDGSSLTSCHILSMKTGDEVSESQRGRQKRDRISTCHEHQGRHHPQTHPFSHSSALSKKISHIDSHLQVPSTNDDCFDSTQRNTDFNYENQLEQVPLSCNSAEEQLREREQTKPETDATVDTMKAFWRQERNASTGWFSFSLSNIL